MCIAIACQQLSFALRHARPDVVYVRRNREQLRIGSSVDARGLALWKWSKAVSNRQTATEPWGSVRAGTRWELLLKAAKLMVLGIDRCSGMSVFP
jgi:hypothetical protein